MDVRCGVRTVQLVYKELAVLYEGSDVRTVNGRFVLPRSRSSWFGVCIAKISPAKKLGDYNDCLITGRI